MSEVCVSELIAPMLAGKTVVGAVWTEDETAHRAHDTLKVVFTDGTSLTLNTFDAGAGRSGLTAEHNPGPRGSE